MGYPNSEWVKPFVHGKVANTIEQNAAGEVRIRFDDGTALRMYDKVAQPITPSGEIITTPFGSDEEVMQSTRIIAGSERSVSSGHDFSHLPWWRKDRFGRPIETIKGRPVLSVLRIVCQNIRKVTGGCCPQPPCSADPFLEEISEKIRYGEPVDLLEAIAAIEYQHQRNLQKPPPLWKRVVRFFLPNGEISGMCPKENDHE